MEMFLQKNSDKVSVPKMDGNKTALGREGESWGTIVGGTMGTHNPGDFTL